MARLWAKDHTVWFEEPRPELVDRLGWLELPTKAQRHVEGIAALRSEAVASGVSTIVLCGMGGSSLAPEVFSRTLPRAPGHPELIVVDSTHPDALQHISQSLDIEHAWFVVSSKSGGTLETMSFMRYFWADLDNRMEDPGSRFIAITDAGSSLEELAAERGFRATFLADPEVGGRYSALTAFGLVPAGLIGCDIGALLASSRAAAALCRPDTPLSLNPAFQIGATLSEAAANTADKVRFIGSGFGAHFGIWVEQLIAESTGKAGTGIIPVDGGPQRTSSTDEVTVLITDRRPPDLDHDIVIDLSTAEDLAGVMFIWELAVAVAGAELGINPFDQPDVQRAKTLANEAMSGHIPDTERAVAVHSATVIETVVDALDSTSISYVAIQAYVAQTREADDALARLRGAISLRTNAATTVGYGPRFLHSTGQLHKGGPSGGVYIQLLDEPHVSMSVPETEFSFNELIAAQIEGDRAALRDAGRTVVSIDLGSEPTAGVIGLANALAESTP